MKSSKIVFCLLLSTLFFGCKRAVIYDDHYRIESDNVVYGVISLDKDGKRHSRKIFDKDSIQQFIQDLNASEYIGICKDDIPQGVIALVVKDSSMIRLDIMENSVRIPIIGRCYKLNDRSILKYTP